MFYHAFSFVNDIKVKKSKITYNNEFILSEIRRYVMKHIQWLNDVLINIEKVDCIIFEKKSQFCCEELRVIDFVYDVKKRHSIQRKSLRFWIDFLVKTSSTFVNLSKFACFIEFSLRISFLLLNRFMRFWKRMFH